MTLDKSTHPYFNNQPVAFVYTPPNHPDSLQVRQQGKNGVNVCTDDMETLRELTKDIRDQIIFIGAEEIGTMLRDIDIQRSRPFTEEERTKLLANQKA